jgi:hypothetical protein
MHCPQAPLSLLMQLPALLLDFMASRRAGSELHCEDFHPHKQPPDCRDAYSDVVWWSTSTSFFTNSVLTFLMVSHTVWKTAPLESSALDVTTLWRCFAPVDAYQMHACGCKLVVVY